MKETSSLACKYELITPGVRDKNLTSFHQINFKGAWSFGESAVSLFPQSLNSAVGEKAHSKWFITKVNDKTFTRFLSYSFF